MEKTKRAAKSVRKSLNDKNRDKMSLYDALAYMKDKAKEKINQRRRKFGSEEY